MTDTTLGPMPEPFGTAHRILTADEQYVGPHRRYVACLGCFEENAARLQEQDAERAADKARIAELEAALTALLGHACTGIPGRTCNTPAHYVARAALAPEEAQQ